MIFNSFNFLIFFVVILFLYYLPLKEKTKKQNLLLLLASYFFYGYADWKMTLLLLSATTIFYFLGIIIQTSEEKKASFFATIGVISGVILLLYFKYFNFFIESFTLFFKGIGLTSNKGTFNIILPLGISFYTFRLISYILEVQRRKIDATVNFVSFATYIAFFPTILSGPIDRPNQLIPQLQTKRSFNYNLVVDGCRQMLWGLFQKIVIADNLAEIINVVWMDIPNQSGGTLLIVAILYSFQLYADFSGYSHLAIGIGKILGFRITKNFNYPFFSTNISEFWRNWHISLTSWFTDYVFMPLNFKFRAFGKWGVILAIVINMLLIGLWHGANWTYIIFGLYHGVIFIPLILTGSIFKKKKLQTTKLGLPNLNDFLKIIGTFAFVTFGFIIGRAENIMQFWNYINELLNMSNFFKHTTSLGISNYITPLTIIMLIIEWYNRGKEFPISDLKLNRPLRYLLYYIIILTIMFFGNFGTNQFIYFKF